MDRAPTSEPQPEDRGVSESIGDLADAARMRREADRELSMSERLARVHELSKQMSAIKGRARR